MRRYFVSETGVSSFRIALTRQTEKVAGIKRWCLDFPVHEQVERSADLTDKGLAFQGWVLRERLDELQIELHHAAQIQSYALDVARPDVVRIILKDDAADHPQLYCGFYFVVQLQVPEFTLGIRWRGQFYPWYCGEASGEFKVLKGLDQWLFLDNDTNQTVEQHLGRLLLDKDCQQQWQQYFAQSQHYQQLWRRPFALLVAPAKEAICAQFHPLPRAALTTTEQLLALCPAGYPLVYPELQLKQAAQPAFLKTDTHWTSFGAGLATIELAVALGLDRTVVTALFAADKYRSAPHCGDLGNKLLPPQRNDELLQTSFSCHALIRYDNKMANFGRIMVIENPNALVSGHCLQFGSSSSYSMLNYLCRIFSRVTLIHTAGNIDPTLVTQFAPDFIVAQTNARFAVRAPVAGYQLIEIMQQKLSGLSVEERQALIEKAAAMAAKDPQPAVQIAHQQLLDALATLPAA